MAIAECHDEARHRGEFLGAHLEHRFNVGHDRDQLVVVEKEEIVSAQARRGRKIELDARAPAAEHESLLLTAIIEFQQQRFDDFGPS